MKLYILQSPPQRIITLLFVAVVGSLLPGCGKNRAGGQDARSGPHSVTLSWTASRSPVAGYYVYRTAPPAKNNIKLNSEPLNATQYIDTTVEAGRMYTYYVTAVDSKKLESTPSTVVSATVPSP